MSVDLLGASYSLARVIGSIQGQMGGEPERKSFFK